MALADGGTDSYTEAGASDGVPIFYCHGAPGSRLDMAWLDDAFSGLGARVVSADRPGIGARLRVLGAPWLIGLVVS